MASKLNETTPASPARQKRSPKLKTKKKGTHEDSPNGEAATSMGCSPSRAVVVQSTKVKNSHLHPTIFMVGEKSFQMLRDLGELKFYHLAQYNEAEDTAENLHHDFAAHLENPIRYLGEEHWRITDSSYKMQERSTTTEIHRTCKNETACTVHVESTRKLERDGKLTEHEKRVRFEDCTNPSHSKPKEIHMTTKNASRSPTVERCKQPLEIQRKLSDNENASLKLRKDSDPLDEIISVPDRSSDHAASVSPTHADTAVEVKSKTKAFFGRNRVMPKLEASDKDNTTKLGQNNESLRSNKALDDS